MNLAFCRIRLPLLLALLFVAGLHAYPLRSSGEAPTLEVFRGKKAKTYLSLSEGPLLIPLEGPGRIRGFAKLHLAEMKASRAEWSISGLPEGLNWKHKFKTTKKDRFAEGVAGFPSSGKKIEVEIPKGIFTLEIHGDAGLLFTLDYDGPEQPFPKPLISPLRRLLSDWKLKKKGSLDFTYDDNIIHYSDDLVIEFVEGTAPWKYALKSYDDLIMTPALDMSWDRKFFGKNKSRFRFKFKRNRYLHNPIKSNETWYLYLRQYFPGGRSLELSYDYTPQKYIRHLTDRPPTDPSDSPLQWVPFRFTSNNFNLYYRHRFSKKVSATFRVFRGLRYYNQPYIEQDLDDLGGRITLYWKPSKKWSLTPEYGFNRATARRYDMVGETPETGNDNDNSYDQNRFQLEASWKPGLPYFDSLSFRITRRIARFTSPKLLWDDPFHVGREDVYTTLRVQFSKKIRKGLGAKLGADFTHRTVNSPYTGDISEGMDYDNARCWMGLNFDL